LTRRTSLLGIALSCLLVPSVPASEPVHRPRSVAAAEVWGRTELFFGATKPDNTEITEADFQSFLNAEITPRFPDGLTVLTGRGQFRNSQGVIIRETSRILIVLYPPQMRDANKKLEDIREAYKTAFAQESVLRVDSFSLVSF
jgi:hypothetical protein